MELEGIETRQFPFSMFGYIDMEHPHNYNEQYFTTSPKYLLTNIIFDAGKKDSESIASIIGFVALGFI